MIKLTFITGGAIRRVFIDNRKVSLMTAELNNVPLQIDLDKLDDKETKKKLEKVKMDDELMKELSLLNTEEEIAEDVKKDFQGSGWRLFKREWE